MVNSKSEKRTECRGGARAETGPGLNRPWLLNGAGSKGVVCLLCVIRAGEAGRILEQAF